jgi:glycosyltransferase involved in cell wall biosynthesis
MRRHEHRCERAWRDQDDTTPEPRGSHRRPDRPRQASASAGEEVNILHVRHELNAGGATEYMLRLASGLIDRGHKVVVAAGDGPRAISLPRDCLYVRGVRLRPEIGSVVPNLPGMLLSVAVLARVVRSERIDIIHAHHRAASLAAKIVSRMAGIPLVSSVHEVRRRYVRLTTIGFGDRVVVLSDYVRTELTALHGLKSDRLRVIPFGIDTHQPSAEEANEARRELGIDGRASVVGCIARLTRRKGHSYLLKAIPAILAKHPAAYFLFVGEGPDRQHLEQMAGELRVADRVRFIGRRTDITRLIAACRLTVLPSIQEEFGIVLLESLAVGRPVIATRVGGIPEVVTDGYNGVLVNPRSAEELASAIDAMLDNTRFTEELGTNGRQTVAERFSTHQFLAEMEAVYRELVV